MMSIIVVCRRAAIIFAAIYCTLTGVDSGFSAPTINRSRSAPRFHVTDLGILPGSTVASAVAINDRGQISGILGFTNAIQAFRLDRRRMTTFPNLPDHPISYVYDMNDAGVIVGRALGGYTPRTPFVIRDYGLEDLGPVLPGIDSFVEGINNLGQIVGYYVNDDYTATAFVYTHGVVRDLPGPFGRSLAFDINELGQAVGSALTLTADGTSRVWHAVVFSGENMVDLGTLPGDLFSQAQLINDRGHVLGTSYNGHIGFRPFLYRDGLMSELPVSGDALAINNSDWIVGTYATSPEHQNAFLFAGDRLYNLNDLIPPGAHWALERASDVNNAGEIVGYGIHKGEQRAFLLTPLKGPTHHQ